MVGTYELTAYSRSQSRIDLNEGSNEQAARTVASAWVVKWPCVAASWCQAYAFRAQHHLAM
eukprot:COSAG02_NODE_68077_length_251_cov_0.914474_1_plen_60_part_10